MRRDTKPYDATTKHLLETDPAGWLEWLGLGRHESVTTIDADLATVSAAADKVIRVGGPASWFAHLELQASYDASLPSRILRYGVLLTDRHDLTVRSVAALFRPGADHPSLSGVLLRRQVSGRSYLHFE